MRVAFALPFVVLLGCAGVAGRPGAGWTHKELLEHLEARGLAVEVVDRVPHGINGPYVRCRLGGRDGRAVVDITLAKGDAEAREKAAAAGGDSFAWGRFWFSGDPEQLAAVRAALNPAP